MGLILIPSLVHAGTTKTSRYFEINGNVTTTLLNEYGAYYLVHNVYQNLQSTSFPLGTVNEVVVGCANSPIDPILKVHYVNAANQQSNADVSYLCSYGLYARASSSQAYKADIVLTYTICNTLEECEALVNDLGSSDTSTQSLNTYKATAMTGGIFVGGFLTSYRFMKRRKNKNGNRSV